MPQFKYRNFHNYNFTKDDYKSKNWSREDIIDRTGYISLEEQYRRMMDAGVQYTRSIDDQYSEDWKDLKILYENGQLEIKDKVKVKRFNDLTDLDVMLKEKMKKYNQSLQEESKIKDAYQRFLKEKETEKIRQDAINDYIAKRKQQQNNQPTD